MLAQMIKISLKKKGFNKFDRAFASGTVKERKKKRFFLSLNKRTVKFN